MLYFSNRLLIKDVHSLQGLQYSLNVRGGTQAGEIDFNF